MTKFGCIHGRFQPFHNGHFEYMSASLARCEHLIVGVTQYERGLEDNDSPAHRMVDEDNPFSFWERLLIIKAVMTASGIDERRYTVIPFPMHNPFQINNFVPSDCVMFTTVYDEWNIKKIDRLREQDYSVEVLWRREIKEFEGKKVREALALNDGTAKRMLPAGAYSVIVEIMSKRHEGA